MKLYYMKREALTIIKSNLDTIYNQYITEDNNEWLWKVCGGNPFEEFKEIPDFSLTPIYEDSSIGEIEFNNCKILYEHLKFITESQACDERLWAGLCHSVFYSYIRRRYNYAHMKTTSPKDIISNIKSRFFFSGGIRAGIYRNTLSKCWWTGHNTYDDSKTNKFEKLDIIGSNDISTKISDIFYSNNCASNPTILNGIIKGFKHFQDEKIKISEINHVRPSLQLLNAIGGGIILDCLDEDEIAEIMIDNIYAILQGDDTSIDIDTDDTEEVIEEEISFMADDDMDEKPDNYVAIGHRVLVMDVISNETKTISVNYLQGTANIPPMAKLLLGKTIDDEITFDGITYKIKEITLRR